MTAALILAAGFGTRLRPLTLELPKPAVPVGDRPLIAHVAAACRAAGAGTLVANAHHEHEKLREIIGCYDLRIDVVVEERIRGTAGGVAGARSRLGSGPVLVWNGDILTEAPARALLEMAAAHDALVLAVSPRAVGEGTVGLGQGGTVVRLRGRSFGEEVSGGDYVGVCALGGGVLADLPDEGCLIGDVALPQLISGRRIWSVASTAPWSDLGDLEQYVAANLQWLSRERGAEGSWAGPGSVLPDSIRLERCVIGAGARVTGTGTLREVIAWPGAPVTAPLERAVVLTSGRVVPFGASAEN